MGGGDWAGEPLLLRGGSGVKKLDQPGVLKALEME